MSEELNTLPVDEVIRYVEIEFNIRPILHEQIAALAMDMECHNWAREALAGKKGV